MKKKVYLISAILILALIVGVYILVTQVGIFSTGNPQIPSCVASSNYYCTDLVYSHITGNLTLTLRQDTNVTWTSWAIAYAPQGTTFNATGAPKVAFSTVSDALILPSGQKIKITTNILPVSSPNTPIGTLTAGTIYVCYTTAGGVNGMLVGNGICTPQGNINATVKYVQLATLGLRAS
jgi:hypothetical protein